MCARTPDRIGAPVTPGDHATPANLSEPETANFRQIASWLAARMLTAKIPTARIRGQVCEEWAGQNMTSGGSRDTAENDWQVSPIGSVSYAVTTTIPVAKWLSIRRKVAGSSASEPAGGTSLLPALIPAPAAAAV